MHALLLMKGPFHLISDCNFRIWAEWEAPRVKNRLTRSRKQRRANKPISMRRNNCILIGLRFSNSDCDPDNLVFTADCKRRNHKKSRKKMDKGLISVTTIPSSLSLPTARGKLASQADFVQLPRTSAWETRRKTAFRTPRHHHHQHHQPQRRQNLGYFLATNHAAVATHPRLSQLSFFCQISLLPERVHLQLFICLVELDSLAARN